MLSLGSAVLGPAVLSLDSAMLSLGSATVRMMRTLLRGRLI